MEILIKKNHFLTVRVISEQVDINTHAILCDYVKSGCGICFETFVGGRERTPSYSCTGPTGCYQCWTNAGTLSDFWWFTKMKMSLKRSCYRSRENAEREGGIEHHSKIRASFRSVISSERNAGLGVKRSEGPILSLVRIRIP
ncbi:hypothetical protein TNCV_3094611 [Trichonephila clavipes]|nr:hypothetical protein TNCV_3094611 [Trichonephila clavipes]